MSVNTTGWFGFWQYPPLNYLKTTPDYFCVRILRWTLAVCYSSRPASAAREKLNEIK
jgi:hypothetical protein